MDVAQKAAAEPMENPAAVADAEQHARQEIAGLRHKAARYARPLAAAAGVVASGLLIRRWRRRR
ncbi:MAG TPA: hypothetical protein VMC03_06260 [Streptosporangiaceae bacterium]|nr:hypothetical protein [Streptosporangiaceae bacterium]